jgi:hypothetical protein
MMKLGTQTGSLINHIYSRVANPEPVVGMGVTICMWSDRHAATIVGIEKDMLIVCEDDVKRTDTNGISESQEYEYTTNPNNSKTYWKKDKKGKYCEYYVNRETNRFNKCGTGSHLGIGYREEYYDFSF